MNRIVKTCKLLVIVFIGMLLFSPEKNASAQVKPETIVSRSDGQVTVYHDTNGVVWLYLPDGTYLTVPASSNSAAGIATLTVTNLSATTATIGTGTIFTGNFGTAGATSLSTTNLTIGGWKASVNSTNLMVISGNTTSHVALSAGSGQ